MRFIRTSAGKTLPVITILEGYFAEVQRKLDRNFVFSNRKPHISVVEDKDGEWGLLSLILHLKYERKYCRINELSMR